MSLLDISNLTVDFVSDLGVVRAVDDVCLSINHGEVLGVVGESGCGKSVTGLSVMRLLPRPQGKVVSGSIMFDGMDLLNVPEHVMRSVRGNKIAMIFQEPMTALNPVYTVGNQIGEVLTLHQKIHGAELVERVVELLDKVGIPMPQKVYEEFPHQLSGGMRQRVMIAMALACNPSLLIADEPTTALDVTIQAQVLELMKKVSKEFNTSVIFITHDLGVIAEMADRVAVMYAGRVVERALVDEIFQRPTHPYTLGLLESRVSRKKRNEKLHCIKGMVPSPGNFPEGCYFSPRCPFAQDKCFVERPELSEIWDGHSVSCFFPQKEATYV